MSELEVIIPLDFDTAEIDVGADWDIKRRRDANMPVGDAGQIA